MPKEHPPAENGEPLANVMRELAREVPEEEGLAKKVQAEPAKKSSNVSIEVEEKKRFWSFRGTKEIIYSIIGEKRKKVLNCYSNGLERISNLLLSPHEDRILFTADELVGGLREIYVVNINGRNLVRITYKGEAAYLTNPGDLGWTGHVAFRYSAPRFTPQTYDFACDNSKSHVLAVTLGEVNQVRGVFAGYYDNKGKLTPEEFTEEQLEEKFSAFYKMCEGWVSRYKNLIKTYDNALRRAREKLGKGEDKSLEESHWKAGIEAIEDLKEDLQGSLNLMIKGYETHKTFPRITENISALRVNKHLFESATKEMEEGANRFINCIFKY